MWRKKEYLNQGNQQVKMSLALLLLLGIVVSLAVLIVNISAEMLGSLLNHRAKIFDQAKTVSEIAYEL